LSNRNKFRTNNNASDFTTSEALKRSTMCLTYQALPTSEMAQSGSDCFTLPAW
jgi:hypothetical protein